MPAILLIRHAQASFGSADYDVLSELGHEQVTALVDGLGRRGVQPARVVSGGLRRQLDTASPCAAAAGLEVDTDARLDEYDDADVLSHHSSSTARLSASGTSMSSRDFQVILNEGLHAWIAAGEGSPAQEPWPAFRARVCGVVEEVGDGLGSGETALVVTSSGVIAALTAALLGLPGDALVRFNHVSVNASITKVVVGRGGRTLVSFNDHAHLEEAGGHLVTYR